ncbi:MAG TPA: alpha/beta fold hydrolase [Myxococcaceae bacterium]|nr:alpha/beta fold hydrolase [Myxococcaceae bacterium]
MKDWANLVALLGFFAAVAALLVLWALVVRRVYRVRGGRPTILRQRCSDGWEIGAHYRPAVHRRFAEPVVLSHGLAANHYNFDFEPPFSLAHLLSDRGFDCLSVDWRGAGVSRRSPGLWPWAQYSVDDHIRLDAPALLELALKKTGATRALWVGHSLGGLIGLAVAQGELAKQLRGLVVIGAPIYFNYDRWLKATARIALSAAWPYRLRHELLSTTLAPFLGRVVLPFSDVIAFPRHIPAAVQKKLYAHLITSVGRGVLAQVYDWIEHNAFRSLDRMVDYRNGIKDLTAPMLLIAGSRDRLAPPANLQWALELARASDKRLRIFGREHGDRQEYGHGDLIFGEQAPREVLPFIADWLSSHATPLDGQTPPAAKEDRSG